MLDEDWNVSDLNDAAADRADTRQILEHIRSYLEAAWKVRLHSVKDILKVTGRGCQTSRESYSALCKIRGLEEEVVKIVREFLGVETLEKALLSVFTSKTEVIAEKSAEVADTRVTREGLAVQLEEVRRQGEDAIVPVRAEMKAAVDAHAVTSH